jgi:glycosyltransferase involved in cell wall biosynthesis
MSGMESAPLVSIILPVYNRMHLIGRAIDSVQDQTVTDWELIVVDDGSTDGLERMVLPMVMQDRRMRYMKHANRKLAASRNIGIHAALGTYLTFVDADDAYKPDHLKLRLGFMRANPGIDIIHGGVDLVGPAESHYVQDARDPSKKIHISECCVGATLFGLREAFLASGGFKLLPYSAESEFLERISTQLKVAKVDFPTYVYHTGLPDSICEERRRDMDAK